jgi:hypothetical protein
MADLLLPPVRPSHPPFGPSATSALAALCLLLGLEKAGLRRSSAWHAVVQRARSIDPAAWGELRRILVPRDVAAARAKRERKRARNLRDLQRRNGGAS